MPHWLFPSMYPAWSRDRDGNIVLLKLPKDLDLNPSKQQYSLRKARGRTFHPSSPRSPPLPPPKTAGQQKSSNLLQPMTTAAPIALLPREILDLIIDYLPPVERVCLALTCKSICYSVIAAPPLGPSTWGHLLPQPASLDTNAGDAWSTYYPRNAYYWRQLPESYTLLPRLAHGWIPKAKLRYCWKCHMILSRDPEFWRRRIKGKKKPKWDIRTSCDKHQWNTMSTKKRFQYLIDVWCNASFEDSSILCCDECREAVYAHEEHQQRAHSMQVKDDPIRGSITELQSVYIDLVDSNLTRPESSYQPTSPTSPTTPLLPPPQSASQRSTIASRATESRLSPLLVYKTRVTQPLYTVECPACLESQLTFTFRMPRPSTSKIFRDFRHSVLGGLWKALWLAGSFVVAAFTITYAAISLLCSAIAQLWS